MKRVVYRTLKKIGFIFFIDYIYDAIRFLLSRNRAALVENMDAEHAKMHLLRLMHSLEKGLSLPEPSFGFGKEKALPLKKEADIYLARFGHDQIHKLILATLAAHQSWQNSVGGDSPGFSVEKLQRDADGAIAGTRTITREQVWMHAKIDFDDSAINRHSIRNFTGEPVLEKDILDAIRTAIKSPSVCNRSCTRAYYAIEPEAVKGVLAEQDGNRGFGDKAGAAIVIAADMRAFYKNGERNQGWVDGGLFAMSLNYALYAKGYGVCMLNWSMDAPHDYLFRKKFGIPTEHLVVMLMASGHIPETLKVAESPRRDVAEIACRVG